MEEPGAGPVGWGGSNWAHRNPPVQVANGKGWDSHAYCASAPEPTAGGDGRFWSIFGVFLALLESPTKAPKELFMNKD